MRARRHLRAARATTGTRAHGSARCACRPTTCWSRTRGAPMRPRRKSIVSAAMMPSAFRMRARPLTSVLLDLSSSSSAAVNSCGGSAVVLAADVDPAEQLQQARAYDVGRGAERAFDDLFGFGEAERAPAAQRAVVRDLRDVVRCRALRCRRDLVEQRLAALALVRARHRGAEQHARDDGFLGGLRLFARALEHCRHAFGTVERQQRAGLVDRRRESVLAAVETGSVQLAQDALVFAAAPRGASLVQRAGDGEGGTTRSSHGKGPFPPAHPFSFRARAVRRARRNIGSR